MSYIKLNEKTNLKNGNVLVLSEIKDSENIRLVEYKNKTIVDICEFDKANMSLRMKSCYGFRGIKK